MPEPGAKGLLIGFMVAAFCNYQKKAVVIINIIHGLESIFMVINWHQ